MKLKDYLNSLKKKDGKFRNKNFAKKLGVTIQTLDYWCSGKIKPRSTAIKKIMIETCGAVQPNDFYNN